MRIFTKQFLNKIGKEIAEEILDKGLSECTWRENNPDAYTEMLTYRSDIAASVQHILGRIKHE